MIEKYIITSGEAAIATPAPELASEFGRIAKLSSRLTAVRMGPQIIFQTGSQRPHASLVEPAGAQDSICLHSPQVACTKPFSRAIIGNSVVKAHA